VEEWSQRQYGKLLPACQFALKQPPLIILSGDTGTGKTALAVAIGEELAVALQRPVTLLQVALAVRGTGLVGELPRQVEEAFQQAIRISLIEDTVVLLFFDEADSLIAARGWSQRHHEDDCGVNAFIQQMDLLREAEGQTAVLLATNRLEAVDPAVQRRAALVLEFQRPGRSEERLAFFRKALDGCGIKEKELEELALATMPRVLPGSAFSSPYSYADLHRMVSLAISRAVNQGRPVNIQDLLAIAQEIQPTPSVTAPVRQAGN
jgi:SpoVK/Ycf46/Vps4 family AAA+-type ATPase